MTDEVPVDVNRQELHSLEVPASVDVDGSFLIRLRNHGESLHVHVHLDDALSELATIDASNHYVEGGSERGVGVEVDEAALTHEPVRGKIKVAAAYGASTRWIDVELAEPEDEDDGVTVDESLAQPASKPDPDESDSPFGAPEFTVLSLGAVAIVVAALAALFLQNVYVLAGAVVVLGGVGLALGFLLWG